MEVSMAMVRRKRGLSKRFVLALLVFCFCFLSSLALASPDSWLGNYTAQYNSGSMTDWKPVNLKLSADTAGNYVLTVNGRDNYKGQRSGSGINFAGSGNGRYYTYRLELSGSTISSFTYRAFEKQGGKLMYNGRYRNIRKI